MSALGLLLFAAFSAFTLWPLLWPLLAPAPPREEKS